ncbi:MAG: puromycin-sensitive aminopeptidase [Acidobacteria bacterium]|nr:puromycin-sensitive aminopeptidase [Acidobacteriota bacterium]
MKDRNPYLLPDEVEPNHYEIELKPNLADFTFQGSERIAVAIRRPVSKITLHALDMKIRKAQIRSPLKAEPLDARQIKPNPKRETITLDFGRKLPRGPAELLFEFESELNDKMHGFYRTSYLVDGAKRWGAATQFEATDARRAFPCWDEPARKATFSVTLRVPEHMTALSNMPVQTETRSEPGWKTITYKKTPRMSTYLLAVVIAELESLEGRDSHGVPIRVYTSPGKREQGRFALEQACHTLPYFADWFGIPYAFPKLDMVALPDFAAGAMENWGLVTYRETALLVDPKNSAEYARQRVAEVVDHELAHQWFGNYTTMSWWTDLWLNEGFASYMGPKATDHRFPEWDTWTQFVADEFLAALHQDALRNTHPVEVPVKNPHEIREVFDAISYSKGSVVNRMVEHYLGEKSFRKGLHNYLRQHAFGNAATDDLWKALEKESGKPVRAIMKGYTRQPGYPVIVAREKQSKGTLTLELEQKRFLVDGGRDSENLRWQIPLGVWTEGAAQPAFEFMKGRKHRMQIASGDGKWVKLNPGQSGFYRVAYSEELWERLTGAVRAGALPTVDRLGLLDDAFALARAGYVKTSAALRVLQAYERETDYSVWTAAAGILDSLDNLLARERVRANFAEAARKLLRPIAARQGWERRPTDGHLDVLLRSLALRNLGGYADQPTIEEARSRFARFRRTGELDPNLRQTVYSLVAENGGEAEWQELMKVYHSTDLHEEKTRVLRAAGSFRGEELIQKILAFSLSEQVRSQDTPVVLASAAGHPVGRALAWKCLKKNWKTFVERYHGGGIGLLSRLIGITSGFTERRNLEDAQDFFRRHRVLGTERAIRKSLEFIRSNVAWLERDRSDLRGYFS